MTPREQKLVEALVEAIQPFAKAGELFAPQDPRLSEMCIYRPAAGDEYALGSQDLLRARAALAAYRKDQQDYDAMVDACRAGGM